MPRAHVGNCQGYDGSITDAMENHLLGTNGDILEAGHQHAAPGIQGVGRIICRQLEGLQFLHQSYDKKKEVIRRRSTKQSNQV